MSDAVPVKTCLHLLVRFSAEGLRDCQARLAKGDSVLLLDDGVMAIANEGREHLQAMETAEQDVSICFSAVDLEARGLSGLARAAGAVVLSDVKIVDLLQSHDFCLTWK